MKTFSLLVLFVISTTFLMYCTKTDQVIGGTTQLRHHTPPVSTSVLISYKTPTAPTIDGTVDRHLGQCGQTEYRTYSS